MISETKTRADQAVEFIGELTLSDDYRGQPFQFRGWSEDIVRRLYETDESTGHRKYREAGIWLPRKNGKTQIISAVCCYEFFCNRNQGEIYTAAAETEQAGIIFDKVSGMIRDNPELEALCDIVDSQKRIINKHTGTLFRSLSSDSKSKHGYNPSLIVGDEIHCMQNRKLWTALTTGSDTRAEPMFVTITTAGLYDPSSFEWEKFDYARKVRDGVIDDPTYLPIIYAAELDEDWLDEEVWHRVNPALGDFRSLEAMRQLAKKAKQVPALENDFRRLYLNQHTNQRTRAINQAAWDACECEEWPDVTGVSCFGGVDLASKSDLTALVLVWPIEGVLYCRSWFWLPEDAAQSVERDYNVPYTQWVRDGAIELTDSDRTDYDFVRARIRALLKEYDVTMLGVDPYNATHLLNQLTNEDGLENVCEYGQSTAMLNEPTKELVKVRVPKQTIKHDGNQVLSWCANNVEVKEDAGGRWRPMKPEQQPNCKIDGITALIMAIGLYLRDERRETPTFDANCFVY